MIKLYSMKDHSEIAVRFFSFPDGTRHVKNLKDLPVEYGVTIEAQMSSSDDIMDILILKDAIDYIADMDVYLYMPYMLGSRQDRHMVYGDPLSVKVYATLINNANFKMVSILDPHSVATTTILNNVDVVSSTYFYNCVDADIDNSVVVAPDAGAIVRARGFAEHMGITSLVEAGKSRNLETQEIISFELYSGDSMDDKDVYIIDDAVTSGSTAITLSDAIREQYTPRSVNFVVTHADSAEAIDKMCDTFDRVYVTNSKRDFIPNDRLTVKQIFTKDKKSS